MRQNLQTQVVIFIVLRRGVSPHSGPDIRSYWSNLIRKPKRTESRERWTNRSVSMKLELFTLAVTATRRNASAMRHKLTSASERPSCLFCCLFFFFLFFLTTNSHNYLLHFVAPGYFFQFVLKNSSVGLFLLLDFCCFHFLCVSDSGRRTRLHGCLCSGFYAVMKFIYE